MIRALRSMWSRSREARFDAREGEDGEEAIQASQGVGGMAMGRKQMECGDHCMVEAFRGASGS
jgi:hypothetical protein